MDNEFGCANGECIPLELRCDGRADCDNNFDEKNCTLVINDEELYRKDSPPLGKNGEKLPINVSVAILSFGRIDETIEIFYLRFLLKLQW